MISTWFFSKAERTISDVFETKTNRGIDDLCDFRHVSAKGSNPSATHKKRCMRRRAVMLRRPRIDEMKTRREDQGEIRGSNLDDFHQL